MAERAGGRAPGRSERRGQATPPARTTSEDLLGGRAELIIVHAGREYRLRVTQNGKLILTA
jgi:hemin uptake protein HemP